MELNLRGRDVHLGLRSPMTRGRSIQTAIGVIYPCRGSCELAASDLLTLAALLQAVNEPGGIRTRDALIKKYLALDGVAP
jgi:hypothetical protein